MPVLRCERLNDAEVAGATGAGPPPRRVLVGGVGYRWLGDASFGLAVSDALAAAVLGPGVEVADLGYGALYVALDLAGAEPPYDRVILVAAVCRGRQPGRIYRRRWDGDLPADEEVLARLREAGAGVIDLDHLLVVAGHLGALPTDVVVIELEPVGRQDKATQVAEGGSRQNNATHVAEGGSHQDKATQVAEGGSRQNKATQVAEGGSRQNKATGSCELSPTVARLVAEVVELVRSEAAAPSHCATG